MPTVTDNCSDIPYTVPGYTFKGVYNGHSYFLSNNTTNAINANAQAIAAGGHLVTISDQAKNDVVHAIYGGLAWIGLSDEGHEGTFTWLNAEPVVYTNWNPPLEPNNQGNENYVVINWGLNGTWNDWNYVNVVRSIIEFDGGFPITQTSGIASGGLFPVGVTTNTFTTHDLAGNAASCRFTVTVTDVEAPHLFCPPNLQHTADLNKCSYSGPMVIPTATDNCPGATVTGGVRNDNLPLSDPYPVGQTIITWTATDAHGLSTSCNQALIITDDQAPSVACPPNFTGPADLGKCYSSVKPSAPIATHNCPGVTIAGVRNDGQLLGDVYPVGVTTIIWTITDAHSHSITCIQSIKIVDNQPPLITCGLNYTHSTHAGLCSYTFTPQPPNATDNCPEVVVTGTRSDALSLSSPFPVGNTTITWKATDAYGQSASCPQVITIIDNELPNAKCKNITVTLVGGTVSITAAQINNGSTDNCAVKTVTASPLTFTCANIGANPVTLTVTDIHNNVNTCIAIVTVVGTLPSCTITAIPNSTVYTGGIPTNIYIGYGPQKVTLSCNATGDAPFTYAWSGNGSLSCTNCPAPVFAPSAPGIYDFTVVVTNKFGCKTTCTIRICVLDIRVPSSKNVYLCHLPPGSTIPQTLTLSVDGVPAHIPGEGIHSGDHLGRCDQIPCGGSQWMAYSPVPVPEEVIAVNNISVVPNPNSGQFKVRLHDLKSSMAEITILDANGSVIEKRNIHLTSTETILQFNHKLDASGMYYIRVVTDVGTSYNEKVVIQR